MKRIELILIFAYNFNVFSNAQVLDIQRNKNTSYRMYIAQQNPEQCFFCFLECYSILMRFKISVNDSTGIWYAANSRIGNGNRPLVYDFDELTFYSGCVVVSSNEIGTFGLRAGAEFVISH